MSFEIVYTRKRARTSNDLTNVTSYNGDDHYMRMAKKRKTASEIQGEATRQYVEEVDQKLDSELAAINSKITRVRSDFERNGQQLVDIIQSPSEELKNRLKSEDERLNTLFDELRIYRTSHYRIDVLHEFEDEKRKFMAEFAEIGRKEKDVLTKLSGHIKEVSSRLEMRIRAYRDLQDRIAVEGQTRRTATTATTVVPSFDPAATASQ